MLRDSRRSARPPSTRASRIAPLLLLIVAASSAVAWIRLLPPRGLADPAVLDDATVVGADGVRRVLDGNPDAYAWMRAARNLLATGDPCDARVAGECRDTRVLGRDGIGWVYGENLHVYAVAWFARIAHLFDKAIPLETAATSVSLLVALVGTAAAVAFGWRVGGFAGGIAASFLPALQSAFVERSQEGDNDAWQMALPMLAALALSESLRAPARRGVALAAIAGVASALCAWAWGGWGFFVAIDSMTLVAMAAIDRATLRTWRPGLARLGTYLGVSTAGAVLVSADRSSAGMDIARAVVGIARPAGLPWPNTFATVAELMPTRPSDVADSVGGWPLLILALLGCAAAGARAWARQRNAAGLGPPVLVAAWLAGACILGAQRLRFLHLVATPTALGWALLAGAVAEELKRFTAHATVATALAAAALQIPVARRGVEAVESNPLRMNRAWWDSLGELHRRAAPDAIVHTWWDYGYWVEYLTDRRDSADSGALGTHAIHWLGRALLAPEAESVGTLRMLGCGADALPLPEGDSGALALATNAAGDDLGGYRLLRALLPMDPAGARAELVRRGVDDSLATKLLHASHCTPPETWIVLSSKQVSEVGWAALGSFDVEAARARDLVRERGAVEAERVLENRSGMDATYASRLVRDARRALEKGDAKGPRSVPAFFHVDPLPCVDGESDALVCESPDAQLAVDLDAVGTTWVGLHERAGTPELTVVVDGARRTEVRTPRPTLRGTAAVVDRTTRRAWIMSPAMARSTFVSLMLLDGRDTPAFEKISERVSTRPAPVGVERVLTYRVRWPESR